MAMITDVMVAAVCFFAAIKLAPLSDGSRMHRLIVAYFTLMGVATALGGIIGHGFIYALNFYWKLPGWLPSMLAVNFLERVMIRYSQPVMTNNWTKFFSWFNIVELLTFAALAFGTLQFLFVEIHSTYGFLVVVFGFCILNYRRREDTKTVRTMMIAVGMIFISAVIFVGRIDIHRWFNHIAFAHIFMVIGAIFFYLGSRNMMLETAGDKAYRNL